MKYCNKCETWKPESEFYKHKLHKDGLTSHCKICTKSSVSKYLSSPKGRLKKQEYKKVYIKTEKGRSVHTEAKRRWRQTPSGQKAEHRHRQTEKGKAAKQRYLEKYPEKQIAKNKVTYAVTSNKIPSVLTQRCSSCGQPAAEYHHYLGYSPENWFDITPLCRLCHKKVHKEMDQ